MNPIDNLKQDHSMIRRLRDIADTCSKLLYQGKYIPDDDIKDLIITIEQFIDRCHHTKEECSLFDALLNKDDAIDKEINALLIEHEFGRRVINMISKHLNSMMNDKEPIARLLKAYVIFLDVHMEREERFFDSIKEAEIINPNKFDELSRKMDMLKDRISMLEAKGWYKGSN